MNYTVNVFNDVIRQLTVTTQSLNRCAIANLNMAKAALSAGILFSVLGSQVGGIGGQVMQFASYAMYATAALQALLAAIKFINTTNLTATIPITQMLSISVWEIVAPIAAAAAVFFFLKDSMGVIPALILAIVAACAAFIAALIIINALGGGGLLASMSLFKGTSFDAVSKLAVGSTYQMGTRSVPSTGFGLLHKGEVVYNPSTGRPTQVGNDLAGGSGGGTMIDASMHVDNLNTRMGEEELQNALRKQSRTIAQNNR